MATTDLYSKRYDPSKRFTKKFESKFEGKFGKFESKFDKSFGSKFGFNQDLDTSDGLYRTAVDAGLQDKADEIIRDNTGEDVKEIFSGGFISDVFDVLNLTSYGVVGLLKGKGFVEGIKNRESFADDDALGQHGLMGVIGGTILDIVTDPLTYIAPWTVLKRIPGVAKVGKKAGDKIFGKNVNKVIDETGRTVQVKEGGLGVTIGQTELSARRLAEKTVWMFGADPVFKDTWKRGTVGLGNATRDTKRLVNKLGKVEPKIAKNLFVREDATNALGEVVKGGGRFKRKSLTELENELDRESFDIIKPIWKQIDENSKELADLGVLGKEKFEDTVGHYLKNFYTEYEMARTTGIFGIKPVGIKGTRARKNLTAEQIAEKGIIDDPQFLLMGTMLKQVEDIHHARLLKDINKKFATDVAQEGFVQLPDTRRLQTSFGSTAELRTNIGVINKTIKGLQKDININLKGDKKLLAEQKAIAKELDNLHKLQGEELTKFLNEGQVVKKTTKTSRRLGTFSEKLQPLAQRVARFDDFDEMMKSDTGLDLEKLWFDGVLERNGFRGDKEALRDFFDQAKKPFKPGKQGLRETELSGNIPKLISLQKRVEKLAGKQGTLSEIDRTSINDSFINLERQLSEAQEVKDDLLEAINRNKMGELAGKYVPKQIADYVDEMIDPKGSKIGNRMIGSFKYAKVVLSPATHIRNIASNRTLNWWKLGIGPWRVDLDVAVTKALKEKDKNKWWREAQAQGMDADTFAAAELGNIADDPAVKKLGKKAQTIVRKLGDLYQAEESYAKLAAFIHQRGKGLNPQDAWRAAESATFNYNEVTPFVRRLRSSIWGMPFITFPLKAAPVVAETIGKNPRRVSVMGKLKHNIEKLSDIEETQDEKASEPQWVKDGFYFKLPWKDSQGRSAYFDLTYIIPFGDLMSGQFFERKVKRDSGLKEGPIATALSKNPFSQLLKDLVTNQDFVGNQIFKESDSLGKISADMFTYMSKTFLPPTIASQIPSTYDRDGKKIIPGIWGTLSREEQENLKRTLGQEVASYFGAKVQPIDAEIQEEINEWNVKKGLETLLKENGVVKDFSRTYIPKK